MAEHKQEIPEEIRSVDAKRYVAESLANLGNLPRVPAVERAHLERYFLDGEETGLNTDEYWAAVDRAISTLRETNPVLADFIEEVGSDIYGQDGTDVLVMLVNMIANSEPKK